MVASVIVLVTTQLGLLHGQWFGEMIAMGGLGGLFIDIFIAIGLSIYARSCRHLNGSGLLVAAFYTWLSMVIVTGVLRVASELGRPLGLLDNRELWDSFFKYGWDIIGVTHSISLALIIFGLSRVHRATGNKINTGVYWTALCCWALYSLAQLSFVFKLYTIFESEQYNLLLIIIYSLAVVLSVCIALIVRAHIRAGDALHGDALSRPTPQDTWKRIHGGLKKYFIALLVNIAAVMVGILVVVLFIAARPDRGAMMVTTIVFSVGGLVANFFMLLGIARYLEIPVESGARKVAVAGFVFMGVACLVSMA
jgi:hypothetical protein